MKTTIVIIVVIILIVLGFFLFRPSEDTNMDVQEPVVGQDSSMPEDESESPAPPAADDGSEQMENTENYGEGGGEESVGVWEFAIGAGSSAEYEAQKEFFSKPTDVVVGTTQGVTGTLSIDPDAGSFSMRAEVDSQTFVTGSSGRDGEVRGYFNGPIVAEVSGYAVEGLATSGNVSFTAPLRVTMNGITKTVNFVVNGNISETGVTARGEAAVNSNDFGIAPPSTAGVYTVDEIIVLRFNITAN